MKSVLKQFAAAAVLFATAFAQDGYVINTPSAQVVCRPLLITWTGGEGPYFLTLHPGAAPDSPPLKDFGQVDGNNFRWVVNVEPGSYGLRIVDSQGVPRQTGAFDVQTGPDTSCIGVDPSSSSAPASSTTGSSTAGSSTSSSGSSTPSSSAPSTSSRVLPSTSSPTSRSVSTPSTSPSSSGAPDDEDDDDSATTAKLGPAILVALAGAAAVLA